MLKTDCNKEFQPNAIYTDHKEPTTHTLSRTASDLDLNFLECLPVQPAANSAPRDVSAVNECFVPRLDSNMKPGRPSRRIVVCCGPHTRFVPHYIVSLISHQHTCVCYTTPPRCSTHTHSWKTPGKISTILFLFWINFIQNMIVVVVFLHGIPFWS